MSKKNIISFQNVELEFANKVILQDCNFSISRNDKVIIFGKSGTGKSTLLKIILGFQQPQRGAVYFNDLAVKPQNILKIRSQIAYVDQDVMIGEGIVRIIIEEYFSLSVNKKVAFSLDKLKKLMSDFELNPQLIDEDINQLSGGERQRLAIVIALMLNRPVMILDEVTSALDPISKKIVIDNLLKQKNKTMLIVTHDREWQEKKQTKVFDFKEKKWVQ